MSQSGEDGKAQGVCGREIIELYLLLVVCLLPKSLGSHFSLKYSQKLIKDSISYTTGSQPIHTVNYLVCVEEVVNYVVYVDGKLIMYIIIITTRTNQM